MESVKSGTATYSGLSIILVNAGRSVGIPARAVWTAMQSNGRGNHSAKTRRTVGTFLQCLQVRLDLPAAACAVML